MASRDALAAVDANAVDPFATGAAPRGPPRKPADAKVITYSRRRNKAAAANRAAKHDADGLATALDALAVATPTRAREPAGESAETATPDEPKDGDYEGPFNDSDSDCGGPGSVLKKAQKMRQDKNRGARLARAAATARDDAAAVRSKLEQQKQFFAEVDGFSLASESEGSCASVAKKTASRGVMTRDDASAARSNGEGFRGEDRVSASAEKIFPSPSAAARAPAPTTPGTKLALTSEWLRAIPESFSPGEAVDEEDEQNLSVDVEEEFVVSDEDEETRGGEDAEEKAAAATPAAKTEAEAEAEDDVALGSPEAGEVIEDIAAALGEVSLDAPTDEADVRRAAEANVAARAAADPPLAGFLAECGQSAGDVPPMAEALESFSSGRLFPDFSLATCRKIGEGTYGEAFKSGETVLKIVPMGGETLINGEPQMGCAQIRAEAAVARRLAALRPERQSSKHTANVTSGFIDTKRVAVCRGPYAPELLEQWRAYDTRETSENENPGEFPAEQLYAIFAFADGGTDLEHADVGTYAEAKSVLLQVTVALAVAEEACRFEHRDLHWGNVLLRKCGADEERGATLNGVDLSFPSRGVDVSVIDFTLSRLDARTDRPTSGDATRDGREGAKGSEEHSVFCDLNADPELFKGPEGHCQSETYRRMAAATGGDWSRHAPETNALWLHYLADCLLEDKRFARTAEQTAELKAFRERAPRYGGASEALWDGVFVGEFKTNYGK